MKQSKEGKYHKINTHLYEKHPKEKQWIADFVRARNLEITKMKKFGKPKEEVLAK